MSLLFQQGVLALAMEGQLLEVLQVREIHMNPLLASSFFPSCENGKYEATIFNPVFLEHFYLCHVLR